MKVLQVCGRSSLKSVRPLQAELEQLAMDVLQPTVTLIFFA